MAGKQVYMVTDKVTKEVKALGLMLGFFVAAVAGSAHAGAVGPMMACVLVMIVAVRPSASLLPQGNLIA